MVVRGIGGENVGGVKDVVGVIGTPEGALAYTGIARKVRRERYAISLADDVVGTADWSVSMTTVKTVFGIFGSNILSHRLESFWIL
jgi:hypothetical protein